MPKFYSSYAAYDHLGIPQFKVASKAATATLDAITMLNKPLPKHVTFKTPIDTALPEPPC